MKETRKNIAIIGSGISGLGIAYILTTQVDYDFTIYEKNDYIGGHSRTVEINTTQGKIPVDTGFIVFNYRNYPLLTSLFSHLNIPVEKSNMSFGVNIDNGWLEYGTQGLSGIFAQKSNLINFRFWRMIADIFKFNRRARGYLECDSTITLGQCLSELKMGDWFRKYYLLAMGGAIWSTPIERMLQFPARTFLRFFENHGLLSIKDQPQWYTVKGGSREYIKILTAKFADRILLDCGAVKVIRDEVGVQVIDYKGNNDHYDAVIFACHSDQALKLIENPSTEEQTILANLRYQQNRVVLHSDISFMPKRKNAWASWVYLSEYSRINSAQMCLSYWMNNLQPLQTDTPIIITLNPSRKPEKSLIYDEYWFEHPVFDESAIIAQEKIEDIQGKDRFWFCGAYQRYGFHEDGLLSAINLAKRMGIKPSWT